MAQANNMNGQPKLSLQETIRWKRQELGLTQADVACAVGVDSADFISLVEKGVRRLDLDRVPALAKVLCIDPVLLCRMAMEEKYPVLTDCLFGSGYLPVLTTEFVQNAAEVLRGQI